MSVLPFTHGNERDRPDVALCRALEIHLVVDAALLRRVGRQAELQLDVADRCLDGFDVLSEQGVAAEQDGCEDGGRGLHALPP